MNKNWLLCICNVFLLTFCACAENGTQATIEHPSQETVMNQEYFYVTAGDKTFQAEFADNSSAEAFKALLEKGNITVTMEDYGNFEKVGNLGISLPRNDTRITTGPGDIILYQGNSITIYYDTNTWNFTQLGKIPGATRDHLLSVLGKGTVTVTFSLSTPE